MVARVVLFQITGYNRVSKGKLYLKVYISSLEVRQNVIGATITNVRSFENHIQIGSNDW